MSTNTAHTIHKESALENFNLSFEYDVTWSDVKKQTKDRTL
jgi:hypothetical protein